LYRAPTADAEIFSLAVAPDGNVWFTELQYHKLGELDPASGTTREITVPSPVSTTPNLYDILVAADGSVWIADMGQNAITRYTPKTALFTWFALPDASSVPYGLAWDSAGHLWFTADRSPTNYVGVLSR
jgi:virginiamycin B lyase